MRKKCIWLKIRYINFMLLISHYFCFLFSVSNNWRVFCEVGNWYETIYAYNSLWLQNVSVIILTVGLLSIHVSSMLNVFGNLNSHLSDDPIKFIVVKSTLVTEPNRTLHMTRPTCFYFQRRAYLNLKIETGT